MTDEIFFTCENHIGLVTLNRPKALNALTLPMILALHHQLQAWQEDNNIHAVVIRGLGGRAFCAGGDVRAMYDHGRENNQKKMEFFGHEYRLNQFIYEFDKPYIALMDGITMGGGVGISLHGSHPVASDRFVFAMPETGIGFYPDIGASHLLSQCPGHFGVYLGLTGNRFGAADTQALGLVKHVISAEQFPAVLASLIEADLSTDAYLRVTDILDEFTMFMHEHVSVLAPMVDDCFQYSEMESIMAVLERNTNIWYQETYRILAQKAPLSLKVTLAQFQKAKCMTMAECLQMDYGLTSHFMQDHDFFEGVRALLVDKDNTPHWQPRRLDEVTDVMVSEYFN